MKNNVVVVLSDVSSSHHLKVILDALRVDHNLKIVFLGGLDSPIISDINEISNSNYYQFPILTKIDKLCAIIFLSWLIFSSRSKFELLFCSGRFATLAARVSRYFKNHKIISIRHHGNEFHLNENSVQISIDKFIYRYIDVVIAVSESVREVIFLETGSKENVVVIENSVSNHRPIPSSCTRNEMVERRILVIARHFSWKGITDAIEGFKCYHQYQPKSKLILVGTEGPASSDIYQSVEGLDRSSYELHTSWVSDIQEFYASAHTMIHVPISPYAEAFGLVYIEALLAGLSCIFTRSGIMRDYEISSSAVHFVAFESPSEICKALKKAENSCGISDQERIKTIARFSDSKMVQKYVELLKNY